MVNEMVNASFYLQVHPLLKERDYNKRKKYLNCIAFYSRNATSRFSKAAIKLYETFFFDGKHYSPTPSPNIKGLFKYRYILCLDIWFINALNNRDAAEVLLNEMVEQSRTFWLCKAKIQQLFKRIYTNDHSVKFTELDTILSVFEHDRNFLSKSIHTAVFTANMSAGKSTLVNALVGKKVNKSQSMACTAKLHYILNKPLEDGFSAEDDNVLNLDADYNTLMTDDVGNDSQSIIVSTYFRFLSGLNNPICFLDTPGVNSSLDHTHKAITDTEIGKNEFDVLVYVINADGGIATEDEDTYLTQLSETAGKANILFVVNKIDCFRADEDNIADSISKIADDVSRRGFVNPKIYPVSAYAGYLAKRMLFDNDLNEGEMDDYNLFRRNFMSEDYNLVGFYPKDAIDVCLRLIEREEDVRKKKAIQMLLNCGILPLEIILKNSIGGM